MKVKANTNVKYGLGWHRAGEIFDAKEEDIRELEGLATPLEEKPAERNQKTEDLLDMAAKDAESEKKPAASRKTRRTE